MPSPSPAVPPSELRDLVAPFRRVETVIREVLADWNCADPRIMISKRRLATRRPEAGVQNPTRESELKAELLVTRLDGKYPDDPFVITYDVRERTRVLLWTVFEDLLRREPRSRDVVCVLPL